MVSGTSYALAAVNAAVPNVPPAPTLRVEPSVPARVRVFETERDLPLVTIDPPYAVTSHEAAVVPEVRITVSRVHVPGARTTIALPPEEFIVTAPVLLLFSKIFFTEN